MSNIQSLSTEQLRKIISIKEQIEQLQNRLESIAGDGGLGAAVAAGPGKRRGMSALGRARVGAAARARWAKLRRNKSAKAARKGKRRLSAAGRAAISAGAKARWAKARAQSAAKPARKKRTVSAAVKARLSAIALARWSKAKAEGKATL